MLMCGHTFLYSPPVRAVEGAARRGRARRALLHLLEPRQPRPAPARRQRDLGPRPARLLDPPLLARRDADAVRAVGRDSIVPGIPDVAFVTCAYASGHPRQRRAELARAEQAAPHGRRRQREDGRLRGRQRRSRSGSSTTASSTRIPRPSASTSSPTGPATSSRRRSRPTSRSPRSSPTSSSAIRTGDEPVASAALARDVVRLTEAAEASLRGRRQPRSWSRRGPASERSCGGSRSR